ncbi:fumarylacetoacetate hydrolase family protein [Amycolatopsis sp. MtRt-6]|uniref:fumarylacetoacetate hydrolase family protein n=1 Tax=Amycolatopsis sp. MtRt-6 TaxID=2792782 RepID=UPI001A8E6642
MALISLPRAARSGKARVAARVTSASVWSAASGCSTTAGFEPPDDLLVCTKFPACVAGPQETVELPGDRVDRVDREVDPDAAVTCLLDDEVVRMASLADMIFDVPDLVAGLSAVCPLPPGRLGGGGGGPGPGGGRGGRPPAGAPRPPRGGWGGGWRPRPGGASGTATPLMHGTRRGFVLPSVPLAADPAAGLARHRQPGRPRCSAA